jgi:hypothetical protein
MSCEAESKAFWDAMNALSEAHNRAFREQRRLEILETQFENVCGYYQGNGEYAFDPLEPGDPDFPPGGPACPEAFSDWLNQFIELVSARLSIDSLEDERRDRWREFSRCRHRAKSGGES